MLSFGELVKLRGELILDQRLGPWRIAATSIAAPIWPSRSSARRAFTVRAGDSIASIPAR